VIELLAGFPSVVMVFCSDGHGYCIAEHFRICKQAKCFVGGNRDGLAQFLLYSTLTEDALTAITKYFIGSSLAWEQAKTDSFYVILTCCSTGIFAAVVLGLGRIFGETMIALMATGNAAMISMNPFDSVRTL